MSVQKFREEDIVFRKNNGIPSTTYGTFALYRYPAKFIPQVIGYVLEKYGKPGMSVLDPFAGYGTVGLVARIYGHDYELWDLNPLISTFHEIATMEPRQIFPSEIISKIKNYSSEFVPDWSNIEYWYEPKILKFLFKVWGFYHEQDKETRLLLTIPLLKTTRYFSYDDTQRQKLSKSPKSVSRVQKLLEEDWKVLFYKKLNKELTVVLNKLNSQKKLSPKKVKAIVRGGVDTLTQELEEERDLLITSPPYLQAQEYIRQAKMDLFWLGYKEHEIKNLAKLEMPYREVPSVKIYSETYDAYRNQIQELKLQRLFDRYFMGVLGAISRIQKKINEKMFIFVGPATVRGSPVPIDVIFAEHFESLNWKHEITLKDKIVSRQLFFYGTNPATGIKDQRMKTESLVIMTKK